MNKTKKIIENVNATMSMEDMPLQEEDKVRITECIEGKVSFKEVIEQLVKKHTHKKVK